MITDYPPEIQQARKSFQALSMADRIKFVANLSPADYYLFRYVYDITLRDNQLLPDNDWRYMFFVGGRGTGKDKMAAVELRQRAFRNETGLMVVAPTFAYLTEPGGMVDSILAEFPPDRPARHIDNRIICHNGCEILLKTTQQNNGIIVGQNASFVWLNELRVCWDGIAEKQSRCFPLLDGSIRLPGAKILITSNPDNKPLFRYLWELHLRKPNVCGFMTGSMFQNEYLDENTKNTLQDQWGQSRFAKMELQGQLDFSAQGALWSKDLIDSTRIVNPKNDPSLPNYHTQIVSNNLFALANCQCKYQGNNTRRPKILNPNCPIHGSGTYCQYPNPLDFFLRIVIGGDPSMTNNENSDDFGIVVCGLGSDGHFYVLEDASNRMGPDLATATIQRLRLKYAKTNQFGQQTLAEVVMETNGVGDWLANAMQTKDANIKMLETKVTQGKTTRAGYVVVLWDQGIGHMVGNWDKLENQMCYYTGEDNQKSPDSFDAMCLAAKNLMFDKNFKRINTSSIKGMR